MAKKSKKKILTAGIYKSRCQGIAGSFESKNTGSQDCETDEKDSRFVASKGAEAWDPFGSSTVAQCTYRDIVGLQINRALRRTVRPSYVWQPDDRFKALSKLS